MRLIVDNRSTHYTWTYQTVDSLAQAAVVTRQIIGRLKHATSLVKEPVARVAMNCDCFFFRCICNFFWLNAIKICGNSFATVICWQRKYIEKTKIELRLLDVRAYVRFVTTNIVDIGECLFFITFTPIRVLKAIHLTNIWTIHTTYQS